MRVFVYYRPHSPKHVIYSADHKRVLAYSGHFELRDATFDPNHNGIFGNLVDIYAGDADWLVPVIKAPRGVIALNHVIGTAPEWGRMLSPTVRVTRIGTIGPNGKREFVRLDTTAPVKVADTVRFFANEIWARGGDCSVEHRGAA